MGNDYMKAKAKDFAKAFRSHAKMLAAPDLLTEVPRLARVSHLGRAVDGIEPHKGESLVLSLVEGQLVAHRNLQRVLTVPRPSNDLVSAIQRCGNAVVEVTTVRPTSKTVGFCVKE